MIIYDFSSQSLNLCVCGDIHGEFKTLVCNLKRLGVENSIVILAGDCGIGFENEEYYHQLYNSICKPLDKANNILLCVRGNHDDPAFFDGKTIDFERMKCIPDYSVVSAAGHKVLCIGGAVSIDRLPRLTEMVINRIRGYKLHPTYWENEAVTYDKQALDDINKLQIDTVITHTCPSFCNATKGVNIENFFAEDLELKADLSAEKIVMEKIYRRLVQDNQPLRSWYYGHFHSSHIEYIENIKFCCLDIHEIKEL